MNATAEKFSEVPRRSFRRVGSRGSSSTGTEDIIIFFRRNKRSKCKQEPSFNVQRVARDVKASMYKIIVKKTRSETSHVSVEVGNFRTYSHVLLQFLRTACTCYL